MKTDKYRDIEIPLAVKPKTGKVDGDANKNPKKVKGGRYSDIVEILAKRTRKGE